MDALFQHMVKPVYNDQSQKDQTLFYKTKYCLCRSKYCRMLQVEHSAILSTFIKISFVIKILVLSIFERPLKTVLLYFILKKAISLIIICHCKQQQLNPYYMITYPRIKCKSTLIHTSSDIARWPSFCPKLS